MIANVVNFMPLYKKTSTGAMRMWTIFTEDNTIVTLYGQLNGKVQEARDTITEGKNVGRANETTAIEQAVAEAKSQWEKKLKKGYVESIVAAERGDVHSVIEGGVVPMLAHKYSEQGHKIEFPCYGQPKLDGHRCIAIIDDEGQVTLWSRTRKIIRGVPHINARIESLKLKSGTILDGELYNHDYKDRFEELTSLIKRDAPKEGHEIIQYHVYDIVNDDRFEDRNFALFHLLFDSGSIVQNVDSVLIEDPEELVDTFNYYVQNGYEGLMVRNATSFYVNKRSYDLQKVKEFQDAEFEIVGVVPGRGKLTEMGMFICKTEDGSTFECKMKGELEGLKKFLSNPDDYIGRFLTVQFQGLTKNGIPRFCVGLRLREDI